MFELTFFREKELVMKWRSQESQLMSKQKQEWKKKNEDEKRNIQIDFQTETTQFSSLLIRN